AEQILLVDRPFEYLQRELHRTILGRIVQDLLQAIDQQLLRFLPLLVAGILTRDEAHDLGPELSRLIDAALDRIDRRIPLALVERVQIELVRQHLGLRRIGDGKVAVVAQLAGRIADAVILHPAHLYGGPEVVGADLLQRFHNWASAGFYAWEGLEMNDPHTHEPVHASVHALLQLLGPLLISHSAACLRLSLLAFSASAARIFSGVAGSDVILTPMAS